MFSISACISVLKSYNKTDDEIIDIIKAIKTNEQIKDGYILQSVLSVYC